MESTSGKQKNKFESGGEKMLKIGKRFGKLINSHQEDSFAK